MGWTMKIKELTIRKASGYKRTLKDAAGNYDSTSGEADVSLTVMSEDGEIDATEVIERVKKLVKETLDPDPAWMRKEKKEESKDLPF